MCLAICIWASPLDQVVQVTSEICGWVQMVQELALVDQSDPLWAQFFTTCNCRCPCLQVGQTLEFLRSLQRKYFHLSRVLCLTLLPCDDVLSSVPLTCIPSNGLYVACGCSPRVRDREVGCLVWPCWEMMRSGVSSSLSKRWRTSDKTLNYLYFQEWIAKCKSQNLSPESLFGFLFFQVIRLSDPFLSLWHHLPWSPQQNCFQTAPGPWKSRAK